MKLRHYMYFFMVTGLVFLLSCGHSNNKAAKVENRVDTLLQQMTLKEKIDLITGRDYWKIVGIERLGIPTINLSNGPVGVRPQIRTPLYPEGVHDSSKTTAFPVPVAMASTWNINLIEETGRAMALESKWKNIQCLLGPGVNIQRVPYGGRNFEYYSEDPYLTAEAGIAAVKGVQSEGVMVSVKHYACNNTEYERHSVNILVDERPLHEIYLYAYKKIVEEANPYTFMSAYNKVNGTYSAENEYLQKDLLKDKWGFDGFVMSDWGATKRVDDPATKGLDLEMPRAVHFGDKLLERVKNGQVEEEVINRKVSRILRSIVASGVWDNYDDFQIQAPESKEICEKAASEGMVLLKNDGGVLPLDKNQIKSVAVIGPNAPFLRTGGWGSSYICPTETVSPLEGLRNIAGNDIKIINEPGIIRRKDIMPVSEQNLQTPDKTQQGLKAAYFNNPNLIGDPVFSRVEENIAHDWAVFAPHDDLDPAQFSARWTGWLTPDETGEYDVSLSADDGVRLYLDDKLIIDTWEENIRSLFQQHLDAEQRNYLKQYPAKYIPRTPGILKVRETVNLEAGKSYKIRVEYHHEGFKAACVMGLQNKGFTSIVQAVNAAKKSDVAVIFAGISFFEEREGADLPSLYLPENQEELIKKVADANPNTVVVLNNGTALLLSEWIDKVPAVIEAWYPGQYGGDVIAGILFGNINPSGKLPMTFMKKWEDTPVHQYYPAPDVVGAHKVDMNVDDAFGNESRAILDMPYKEGIYVGYRHYDKFNVEPLFAFGHGLSYTTFKYEELRLQKRNGEIQLKFNVTNTGSRAGAEVSQVYVQDMECSTDRPLKELKGFNKVFLNPGETKEITLKIEENDLAFYDPNKKEWTVEPGEFKIHIGSSSRDIRLAESFQW